MGITRETSVVAYDDQGGAIAARFWWMLGWIGHPQRYLLDGGLTAWLSAELPVESGELVPEPVQYDYDGVDDSLTVTTAEIAAWHAEAGKDSASKVLIDARTPARFRGEQEPIDPIAGHVPGACNLPFNDLLDADQRFLSAEGLEAAFTKAGGQAASQGELVAMCGSGVTGCHLLAGLAVTGKSAKLYVGSWSEWIRDPARPIATGD